MRDGYLRGELPLQATKRQMDVLAAYVAAGGSVHDAAELVGIQPSTVKRHLADLRSRMGLTTEQSDLCRSCWRMARRAEPRATIGRWVPRFVLSR
jgi:DNA-binding NarL/FixJ family response regulator